MAGAVYTTETSRTYQTQGETDKAFIFKDHLGSTDVITGKSGQILQSMSFDAWGQRRDANTWTGLAEGQLLAFNTDRTNRGYTGHEQLDEVGLVHMNGRVYDPKLARFLQADPFIQAADNTQSYNRYSYLMNNPLNATDPSGFFLDKLWEEIRPFAGAIVAIGLCVVNSCIGAAETMAWIGAVSGAVGAAANGAGLKGIALSALTGAVGGYHGWFAGAMTAGLSAELQGGEFGRTFVAAGVGALIGGSAEGGGPYGFIAAAISGGISREIMGGKFKNGAATAAFSWVLSQGVKRAFKGDADTSSVLDGPVGEGVSLHDGKVSVHAAGEGATLTDDQLSTVKSDLDLIF